MQKALGTGNVTVTYSKVSDDKFFLNDNSSLTISDKYIYGDLFLKADETEFLSQFKNDNIHIEKTGNKIGTGSKLEIVENNIVTSELTVVIFGDVNGDGECDGQDAVIVSCIAFGLTNIYDLSEEYRIAADCNQDGNIDKNDSSLLIESGLGLIEIPQTPTQAEEKSDIYEIEAEVPYTAADLAYYTGCRADREQQDPTARPKIANKIADTDRYDTIVLGYPIWHGMAPKIIYTFLESYDLSNKTIAPFCTSASSGIGNSDTALYDLTSKNVNWKKGKRFAAGASENELKEWLKEVGIK